MSAEIVLRAAIRLKGKVWSAPPPCRHHDVIALMMSTGIKPPIVGEQGFWTSAGRFVGRKRAYRIAAKAGQLKPALNIPAPRLRLFSEDLW